MTYFSPGSSGRPGGRKDDSAEDIGEPRRIGRQPSGGFRGRSRPSRTSPVPPREAPESAADRSDVSLTGELSNDAIDTMHTAVEPTAGAGPDALAAHRQNAAAEPPSGGDPDPAAARRAGPAPPRSEGAPGYRPDDPPGDLAGLFPAREPRPEPPEPSVIDLTRHEPPAAASDEPSAPAPDRAVPPGFPVELPQPSLRREQLLLTAVSWLIVLFTTLLGALGGLTYSSLKTATYTATSSVIVTPTKGAPVLHADPASFANAYAQVALDTPVLQPALADAGISMAVDDARRRLQVSVPDGSALITVRARASSGADAAALANAAASGISSYGTARSAATGYDVSRFTAATAPTTATRPHRALSVLIGALIGLAVGGAVVLMVRRSRRVSPAAAA